MICAEISNTRSLVFKSLTTCYCFGVGLTKVRPTPESIIIVANAIRMVSGSASKIAPPKAVTGGTVEGAYVAPTIYECGAADAKAREEIFGPVLSVVEVATDEEAIAVANDTSYGLAASVFTANTRKAIRAARDIKAGTVTVNCYGEGDISTPFGGYKRSGFGGRDNGLQAHDQYTEIKTIWVDLTDPMDGDNVG